MNKSVVANLLALAIAVAGYLSGNSLLSSIGLFAVSGAITNWIAIHMLFEKVPGFYGSGVIPNRFEDFKAGIESLMMEQFFTEENIDRFLSDSSGAAQHFDLAPIVNKTDFEPAFEALVSTIQESSFAGMLSMVGGVAALEPLKQPYIDKMRSTIIEITNSDSFDEMVREEMEQPQVVSGVREKVQHIIKQRLDELTPQLVKEIIQDMIRKHLGWLVVWGAVFGGFIGFLAQISQVL